MVRVNCQNGDGGGSSVGDGKESKEIEKSKDWRVRVRFNYHCDSWSCSLIGRSQPCSQGKAPNRKPSNSIWQPYVWCLQNILSLTLQPLLFWRKSKETHQKARVLLFAEPLKSFEKKGKTQRKNKENRKTKKQARIGGSGFPGKCHKSK